MMTTPYTFLVALLLTSDPFPGPWEIELDVPPGYWLHQLALEDPANDLGHGLEIEIAANHAAAFYLLGQLGSLRLPSPSVSEL